MRQQAADREADDGGADDQLAAVLADLAAPVGELGDAAAQGLDRVRRARSRWRSMSARISAELRPGGRAARRATGSPAPLR